MTEKERISDVYNKWEDKQKNKYSDSNPGNRYLHLSRDEAVLSLLKKIDQKITGNTKILEAGSGYGGIMLKFASFGAELNNIFGADLLMNRLNSAKERNSGLNLICCDAGKLPFENGLFDTILQFTLFSSILDNNIKLNVAEEMVRLLKPGGWIIWYDVRFPNYRNPNVREIGSREIKRLFPDSKILIFPTTLLPPLARILAPVSFKLCRIFEMVPFLRSHYIAAVQPGNQL